MNPEIQIRNKATGAEGFIPFNRAIRLWVSEKSIDVQPNAEIHADGEDLFECRLIVKGIYDLMAENANVAYSHNKGFLDENEQTMLNEVKPFLREAKGYRISNHDLIAYLHGLHPTFKDDTIRRRLDSMVEKARLAKTKEGIKVFYELLPLDRIELVSK